MAEAPAAKAPYKKVIGQSSGGAAVGTLVAWSWNGLFPDYQMTAEVAGSLGGLLGPPIAYMVSWLPQPKNGE